MVEHGFFLGLGIIASFGAVVLAVHLLGLIAWVICSNFRTVAFLAAGAAIALASPVHAENAGCDLGAVRMNAVIIRATVACHKDWMDRPGGYKILALARACAAIITPANLKSEALKGFKNFDGQVASMGLPMACNRVEDFVAGVEGLK